MSIDTIRAEETRHPLAELGAWISQKDDAEISVVELYGDGPSRLDISELELREWVNEGLALQMLALEGLTGVVKVVNQKTTPTLPNNPPQRHGY